MNPELFFKTCEEQFHAIAEKFRDELKSIRSNRPSIELVEGVMVNYYEQMTPVNHLASITVGPSHELQITVWDRNALAPVTGAIQAANLGFSLQNEGNTIRAFLPTLSSERREELGKLVKKTAEGTRIQVRHRRDEAMKELKNAEDEKSITEDQLFKGKEQLQKQVDKTNEEIEKLVDEKIKELSE